MNKMMTATFHGSELMAFDLGGLVVVALKPIVDGMGLDWSAQYRRVRRDPILSEGIAMMAIPSGRGGKQEYVCLRLDLVHGWLFKIDSTRVRADLRDRVLTYQRECYAVLFACFSGESEKLRQQRLESEGARVRMVTEVRHTYGLAAAQEMWVKLELPYVPAMAKAALPKQPDLFEEIESKAAA